MQFILPSDIRYYDTLKRHCLHGMALGIALLLAGNNSDAIAQSDATVSTRILTPVTVTNNSDLNFGRIVPGTSATIIRMLRESNTLELNRGNARLIGGTVQRGGFTIAAEPLTRVQITLPETLNIVLVGGTETMRVNRFRLNGNGSRRPRRNINNTGVLDIFVSAQLRVRPSQEAGVYRGNYNITVEYN